MKLTQWFKGVRPSMVGVYQTREEWESEKGLKGYQYWNGEKFMWWDVSPEAAFIGRHHGTSLKAMYWRGLAEDPNKKEKA